MTFFSGSSPAARSLRIAAYSQIALIAGDRRIDLQRPSIDAAREIGHISEAVAQQKLGSARGAASVMTLDEQRFRRIGKLFRGQGRPLRQGQEFRAGDAGDLVFIGLAHIDEAGRVGCGEAQFRLSYRNLGDSHRQLVIETGVPTFTFSKNFWAMKPGMRMQPWEAG